MTTFAPISVTPDDTLTISSGRQHIHWGYKVFVSRWRIMRSKSKQSRTVAVVRRFSYTGQTYDFAAGETLRTAEVGL